MEERDDDLTVAERVCVMTSSEEDVEYLNACVSEKLQLLCEKGLDQIVGDDSLNVEGILNGNYEVVALIQSSCGPGEGVYSVCMQRTPRPPTFKPHLVVGLACFD